MRIPPAVGWWNNCVKKTGKGSKRGGEFSFSSCCTKLGDQTLPILSAFVRIDFFLSLQMTLLKEAAQNYLFSLLPWLRWDQGLLPALPATVIQVCRCQASLSGECISSEGEVPYMCYADAVFSRHLLFFGLETG